MRIDQIAIRLTSETIPKIKKLLTDHNVGINSEAYFIISHTIEPIENHFLHCDGGTFKVDEDLCSKWIVTVNGLQHFLNKDYPIK